MKKIIILSLLLLFVISAFGQDSALTEKPIRLSSIELSTGKSALSTGFSAEFNFETKNNKTQIVLREDRIFINSLGQIKKIRVSVGPSVGYFQNVPFAGAIAVFAPFKFFSTLHWVGYSFGEPNAKLSFKPSFLFLVNSASVKVWRLTASYSIISFMELPTKQVVGLCYKQKILSDFFAYTDVGYDITNKEQLLKVGVIWKR